MRDNECHGRPSKEISRKTRMKPYFIDRKRKQAEGEIAVPRNIKVYLNV